MIIESSKKIMIFLLKIYIQPMTTLLKAMNHKMKQDKIN